MKQNTKRNKAGLWAAVAVLLLCGLLAILIRPAAKSRETVLTALSALKGPERTVSAEEEAFFAQLSRKQGLPEDEESVRAYLGRVNAEFYLGSRMGICEEFDYDVLKYRTQAENTDREMKKLAGQIYYGPDSFTEESYFQYIYSRLRSDLVTWLVDHRDREMTELARSFYDRNREGFNAVKSVTYEVTRDGATETKTLEDTLFRTMGQSDPALMDFLAAAEIGEEKLLTDGSERLVKKLEVKNELTPFEEQERFVTEVWLLQEALDELAEAVAQNTELVF